MKTHDFYYDLPEELIAQVPIKERTASRLLVLDKNTGETEDRHFSDLPEYLHKGDVLVINNTRVIPARLLGSRADDIPSNGKSSRSKGTAHRRQQMGSATRLG